MRCRLKERKRVSFGDADEEGKRLTRVEDGRVANYGREGQLNRKKARRKSMLTTRELEKLRRLD